MSASEQKIVQYLQEARASEHALTRVLQSQIAMTPRGTYRTALERHLEETRGHANRVSRRLRELGEGGRPITTVVGLAESLIGHALAFGKTPIDMLRGTGGEEKVLKNAKDASATEALEIATYTSIERLARKVGDDTTADLAASILADEEKMLATILREIPKLTDAVARAEIGGDPSYDIRETGAADAVRGAGEAAREAVVEGVTAVLSDQPWPGYDEQTAAEVVTNLRAAGEDVAGKVAEYERANKARAGVLKAAERKHAAA